MTKKGQNCGITGPTLTTKYFISRKHVCVIVNITVIKKI